MKLLLVFALCVFSVCAFAQFPKKVNPRIFQLPDTLKMFKGNKNTLLQPQEGWQGRITQNNLLANRKGNIAVLPQDNMPCIIPDTSTVGRMPNAWGSVTNVYVAPVSPIPNPGLPKIQSFKWNALDNGLGIPSK